MIPYAVRPSIFVAAKVLPSAEEPNILLQCHCLACKLHKDFCQVALCYFTTIFNTSGHSDWATLGMSIKEGEQKANYALNTYGSDRNGINVGGLGESSL